MNSFQKFIDLLDLISPRREYLIPALTSIYNFACKLTLLQNFPNRELENFLRLLEGFIKIAEIDDDRHFQYEMLKLYRHWTQEYLLRISHRSELSEFIDNNLKDELSQLESELYQSPSKIQSMK